MLKYDRIMLISSHVLDPAPFVLQAPPISYDAEEEEDDTDMATSREELLLRVARAESAVEHLTRVCAETEARCRRYEDRAQAAEQMVIRGAVAVLTVWMGLGTLVMVTVFRLAGIDLGSITGMVEALIPGP